MFIQKIFIAIIKVFDNVKFSLLCHIIPFHYSLFAIRYSLFAICYSLFAIPIPYSLLSGVFMVVVVVVIGVGH